MSLQIDVLIPSYEPNAEYLTEALKNLQAQTFQNWHAFIHDDASKVDARAIVEPFLNDPRITFERSTVRLGIAGNWNACIEKTSNPILQFLFQDDLWYPEYLERAVAPFDDPTVGIVSVNHDYLNREGLKLEEYENVKNARSRELPHGKTNGMQFLRKWMESGMHPNIVGEPPFVMFRRELFEKVGPFNKELPQSLDAEYWVRLLQHTDMFNVTESSGAFRVHSMGTSAKNQREAKGMFDRLLMFRRLISELHGNDRKLAKKHTIAQFSRMVEKFKNRVKMEADAPQGPSKKKALIKFSFKHPVFMMWCGIHYLLEIPRTKNQIIIKNQ